MRTIGRSIEDILKMDGVRVGVCGIVLFWWFLRDTYRKPSIYFF